MAGKISSNNKDLGNALDTVGYYNTVMLTES